MSGKRAHGFICKISFVKFIEVGRWKRVDFVLLLKLLSILCRSFSSRNSCLGHGS